MTISTSASSWCPYEGGEKIGYEYNYSRKPEKKPASEKPTKVTYFFGSGLQVTSYLTRTHDSEWSKKDVDYEDTLRLEDRVKKMQDETLSKKKIHYTVRANVAISHVRTYVSQTTDPETQKLITSVPRHESCYPNNFSPEDFSFNSPPPSYFDTPFWKQQLGQLGMGLSMLNLTHSGSKIIDDTVRKYMFEHTAKISNYIEMVDEKFLEPLARQQKEFLAHETFASINWYLCARLVLGISEEDFVDYAYVWNSIFRVSQGGRLEQLQLGYTKYCSLDRSLYPYMIQQVRKCNLDEDSLLSRWINKKLAEQVIDTLSETEKAKAEAEAEANSWGISLSEKVLVDNALALMVAMQETVAYTLTEALYQFNKSPELQNIEDKDLQKALKEIMRVLPASGSMRQFAFDTKIITSDGQKYKFKKGEYIGLHPAFVAVHPDLHPNPLKYDLNRPKEHEAPIFGKGPHACPGQVFARNWITDLLRHIIKDYHWSVCETEPTQHVITFATRHYPPLQFAFWPKGSEQPDVSSTLQTISDIFKYIFT